MIRQIPNLLTLFRIVAGPAGAACLIVSFSADSGREIVGTEFGALSHYASLLALIALVLFVSGALSDLVDGIVARRFNAQSKFGILLDPIADKIFVAAWLIAWVWLLGGHLLMAIPAAAIIARDILMTGVRLSKSRGGNDVHPVSANAKMKTALEMVTLGFPFLVGILAFAGISAASWPTIETWIVLIWLSAALSLYTGLGYLLSRRGKVR